MNALSTPQDTQLVSSISADKLAVKDIFSDNYLFTIPNYQRPYSWEEEHCTQLLDDLHTFAFKDEPFDELPPYFLGSAVIIKREHIRNAQIVDGQQRLTTLTILLSCLRYAITDQSHKDTISEFIFQKGNKLKGTSATYRLRTRSRDQDFFNSLIQEENGLANYFAKQDAIVIKNDAQTQMLMNAKALLDEFNRKPYSQEQLELLVTYIIQKCVIVMVASTDEDMAFRIFNVLNDRGKDLTIADILKSEVLEKIAENEQSAYTEKWEDCETKLGSNNFKNFFGYLRAIYAKKKAEKSVISEIREYVRPTDDPKGFVDHVLIPFTDAYHHILQVNYKAAEFAEIINMQFRKLKRVGHTDWMPSAIFFMAKHANAPEKVKDFLLQLERLTLGMEGMKTSLNERLERYAKVNTKIENGTDLYLPESEFMLSAVDRTYIIATLRSPDIYGKRLVKPILARIEEEMNDGSITIHYGGLNIEHVLPQTPNDIYWTSRFSTDEKLKYTNCLGNLSLITVRKNSQAKNFDFVKKVNTYFREDGKASNLAMVNRLLDYSEWKSEFIAKRNTLLINLFLKALGLTEIVEDVKKTN